MLQFYKDNPDVKHVPDKPGDEGELFGQISKHPFTHFINRVVIYYDDA